MFISSNFYLNRFKRALKNKKAGFSGTLDPFAKGCLIVAFGQYAKLFKYLAKTPKTYKAVIWLGVSSESLDIERIQNIDIVEKQKDNKIKLLYTSTPWRGLAVLIKSIEILNKTREDFEVDIYSSTKIYGSKFDENEKDKFEVLFDKCKNTPNVNYLGYADNDSVRAAVQKAHIYAYPSIFEETSCLAVIEAMSAGCHVVTTNYGALPETCGEFATMIEFDSSGQNLIERYAETLNSVIDNYKNNLYKDDLEMQIKYYNKNYSWETRIQEWKNFLNYVRTEKTR